MSGEMSSPSFSSFLSPPLPLSPGPICFASPFPSVWGRSGLSYWVSGSKDGLGGEGGGDVCTR